MQITQQDLHVFLSAHLGAEITGVEPVVGHGEWSQTFFFSANDQRKVIRFSKYDEDFKKDRFAARYASPGLPVPPIEEIGEAFGLFFAISPRVDGQMIDGFSAGEWRAALPALLELLNALREVDDPRTSGYGGFSADGNGGLASWREFLTTPNDDGPGSRITGWKERLAGSKEAAEVYRQGRERLLGLVRLCPEERRLVHNDLLHFNLIMDGRRVAAVIDWGCALWGDPLYDLAMFITWQFYYPAMAGIDFAGQARQFFDQRGIAMPYFAERLEAYQLHLLLDSLAYNAWKEDGTNLGITMGRMKEVLGKNRRGFCKVD